ncbi:glycosyltransferase 87 family protein [Pseudonocardia asaccharolytica]|uniref:Membrane protein n=1 Tax=Pseudonocardia asaccharolytica DSM 44247 = NBRC 16224 TaxID=1123024 RepID=A0A511D4D6_9PSEU|nr:glycosyltransferase 87 family protein [Pseudonocardia asaccharolytica]GEL19517.1 membrane protein [Pseudonocardia asaccharolytica DSM 44247 = NBRC 16224]
MSVSSTSTPAAVLARRLRARLTAPRSILVVTLPALALVLTWLLVRTHGYHIDLEVYRLGVQTWLAGEDMYGSLPPTVSGLALPFIYPPFAAMVLTPLVLLPWTPSWIVLFVLSLASLAVTLYAVALRSWPAGGRAGALAVASAALPLALLLEPVRETFEFGQVNLVLMALVALDCLVARPRWPRGLLVGLAAAIKLTPAVFVLYFLLRRDLRAAIVAAAAGAAATGLGFLVDPAASVRYWFDGPASGISGSVFYTNETIEAVLARMGLDGTALTAGWLAVAALLLVLAIPMVRSADAPLALVTVATLGLLVSPTSWSHHWVWIAPALVVTVGHALRERSPGWATATGVLLVAFYLAPFQFLPHNHERELGWSGFQQVVGATYVIVAVALLVAGWWWYGPARRRGRQTMSNCSV